MGQWQHRLRNIDPETKRGDCAICGPNVSLKRKSSGGQIVGGQRWACRPALAKYRKRPGTRHGLSRDVVDGMIDAQGGVCPICGEDLDRTPKSCRTHVDHDHKTGAIRGVLCGRCNTGIGHLRESPEIMRKAISYLAR